jgi:hypothetical protein
MLKYHGMFTKLTGQPRQVMAISQLFLLTTVAGATQPTHLNMLHSVSSGLGGENPDSDGANG